MLICEILRPITPVLLKKIIMPIPSRKMKLNRGVHLIVSLADAIMVGYTDEVHVWRKSLIGSR